METSTYTKVNYITAAFQKDLIVWKLRGKALSVTSHTPLFQKDLIVWKPKRSETGSGGLFGVSEGLNSVETTFSEGSGGLDTEFQKDLIVWKHLHIQR